LAIGFDERKREREKAQKATKSNVHCVSNQRLHRYEDSQLGKEKRRIVLNDKIYKGKERVRIEKG